MSQLLFVLGLGVGLLLVGHWRKARHARILTQTARELGLTYRPLLLGAPPPEDRPGGQARQRKTDTGAGLLRVLPPMWQWGMVGVFDGTGVSVSVHGYSAMVRASFDSPLDLDLRVDPQVSLDAVANAFGQQDIVTGTDAFDRQFVIRGRAPEAIAAVFRDPAVQQALPDAFAQGHRGWVDDRGVVVLSGSRTPSATELRPVLAATVHAARAIAAAHAQVTRGLQIPTP